MSRPRNVIRIKGILIGSIILLYVFVVVPYVYIRDAREKNSSEINPSESVRMETNEMSKGMNLLKKDNLLFFGDQTTEDNPWKMTAGLISSEEYGECIFLTPETSVKIKEIEVTGKYLNFSYMLYPQVREKSDGASIIAEVYLNNTEKAEITEKINISPEEDWTQKNIDVSRYKGSTISVRFIGGNGENGNDDADWVIINNVRVEE